MLDLARSEVQLRMDDQGRFADPGGFKALIQHAREFQTTHLFLLALGGNNSRRQAETSCQAVLSLMGDVVDQTRGLRPAPYRPLDVGIHWPSKACDEQTER